MQALGRRTAAIAAMTLGAFAHGQVEHHLAASTFESGPWVFHPVYTLDTATAAVAIEDFVAILDPAAAVDDNLVAVWFRRDAGTGDWEAWSWDTTSRWAAINHVKSTLALGDGEDDLWKTPGLGLGIPPLTAEAFGYGVLAADDLADDIPVSPDPDALIALLVASGYRAASLPLQHLDGCKVADKLDGMAMAFRETLFEPWSTAAERMMSKWFESGSSGCDLADDGIAIIDFPIQLLPPSPVEYECYETQEYPMFPLGWIRHCRVISWTWTNMVTQKRTRARFNPAPPPLYEFCDQTRTGQLATTVSCSVCTEYDEVDPSPVYPPPCPDIAPGTKPPMGSGCGVGGFGTATISTAPVTWSVWEPECDF